MDLFTSLIGVLQVLNQSQQTIIALLQEQNQLLKTLIKNG